MGLWIVTGIALFIDERDRYGPLVPGFAVGAPTTILVSYKTTSYRRNIELEILTR
jgi:hypothetical protein